MVLPRAVESTSGATEAQRAAYDLDDVYREYAGELSRWLRRLTGSAPREEVQDLLHEVFLVVQRRLPDFRGDSTLKTWLFGIATRVVTAHRRKARLRRLLWQRTEPALTDAKPPPETPLHLLERERTTALVYELLDRLSERDRTILILFELEQMPSEEVAQILDVRPATLWVNLHRARSRLKALLVKFHPELVGPETDDASV